MRRHSGRRPSRNCMPGDMRTTERLSTPNAMSRMANKTSWSAIVSPRKSSRPGAKVKLPAPPSAPPELSLSELRGLRLRAQRLAPRLAAPRGLLEAVRDVVGVNAQLVSAMALSLRARVAGLTWEQLEQARLERRTLVRTWCMRGTLHLLPADELEALLGAVSPNTVSGVWRWLERRAGLRGERARQVADVTYQVLRRNGPLTRRALMAQVSAEVGFDAQPAAAGAV